MDEDGKGAVVPFLAKERFNVNGQKLPMNYPIVLGNDEIADKFGGLLGYPTGFLISRDGKVVKKFQGLTSFDDIAKAIESQLQFAFCVVPVLLLTTPTHAPTNTCRNYSLTSF